MQATLLVAIIISCCVTAACSRLKTPPDVRTGKSMLEGTILTDALSKSDVVLVLNDGRNVTLRGNEVSQLRKGDRISVTGSFQKATWRSADALSEKVDNGTPPQFDGPSTPQLFGADFVGGQVFAVEKLTVTK